MVPGEVRIISFALARDLCRYSLLETTEPVVRCACVLFSFDSRLIVRPVGISEAVLVLER